VRACYPLDTLTAFGYTAAVVAVSCETPSEIIELRQQANYWRAQHRRAVEREAAWRERAQQSERLARDQEALIRDLRGQNEALKAKLVLLSRQVFGRKSEKTEDCQEGPSEGEAEGASASEACTVPQRRRGKQPGTKGYGRRRRMNLPVVEVPHDLPEAQKRCPICGKPFAVFPGTEDSEELDWEVRIVRRVHRRLRYLRSCGCQGGSSIVTAPAPAKLIPKGMFSVGFWVRLLLEKYLFQRPLYRVLRMLALEGLDVSQGTLTGGLRRIGELMQPVYALIQERNRSADHWHMDETRWMVFAELEGKVGHRWWLWVSVSADTCVYILDPSRSAEVPRRHLGENAVGIISADRYSAYKALGGKLLIAFCWTHLRRDYVRIHDSYRKLREWADGWLEHINGMFARNARRLFVRWEPEAFAVEDQGIREAAAAMAEKREAELAEESLHSAQRKALLSMREHWEGLLLFIDHPDIPIDNSEAERRVRNPVAGRKNYYGSGAVWSGMLAAMMFTIMETLLMNQLSPLAWLTAYLQACAEAGGRSPETIESFLPWRLSEQQRAAWGYPSPCARGPP
jgi:transposase